MLLAAAAAVLEMPPFLPSVVVGVILFGISIPWLVVGFTTLLQRLTPPDLQGRVYAAADTLVTTPQTISIAAGAALIGITGYQPLLAALAAVVTLAAAYLLTAPSSAGRPRRLTLKRWVAPRRRRPGPRPAGRPDRVPTPRARPGAAGHGHPSGRSCTPPRTGSRRRSPGSPAG